VLPGTEGNDSIQKKRNPILRGRDQFSEEDRISTTRRRKPSTKGKRYLVQRGRD
jgi:hypothetical protein